MQADLIMWLFGIVAFAILGGVIWFMLWVWQRYRRTPDITNQEKLGWATNAAEEARKK